MNSPRDFTYRKSELIFVRLNVFLKRNKKHAQRFVDKRFARFWVEHVTVHQHMGGQASMGHQISLIRFVFATILVLTLKVYAYETSGMH